MSFHVTNPVPRSNTGARHSYKSPFPMTEPVTTRNTGAQITMPAAININFVTASDAQRKIFLTLTSSLLLLQIYFLSLSFIWIRASLQHCTVFSRQILFTYLCYNTGFAALHYIFQTNLIWLSYLSLAIILEQQNKHKQYYSHQHTCRRHLVKLKIYIPVVKSML